MVLSADLSDTLAVLFTNGAGLFADELAANVGIDGERPEADAPYELTSIYPNPTYDGQTTVNVEYRAPRGHASPTAELFDVLGRKVPADGHLASGFYFVRLKFDADFLSEAKALIVTSPGDFQLQLRHIDGSGSAPVAMSSGANPRANVGKTASTGALLRVEKAGFVSEEQVVDLVPQSPVTANFELDAAAAPSAAFTVGGTLQAGKSVVLDASSSVGGNGEALSYSWSFGDGLLGGGAQLAHVYTTDGTFDVVLTVAGEYGATASATQQVTVAASDPPISNDGTLIGNVSDIAGFALGDVRASIVGTDLSTTTNPYGALTIEDAPVGVPLAVRLERSGYATQVIPVGATADTSKTRFFEAAMRARDTAIEVTDAENGFMTRSRDGVMVQIPFDALMHEDGSPAAGPIQVAMTPVNVASEDEVRSFPGRFSGVLPAGDDALLLSLGTAEYSFEQNGKPLQLAPGKTANVEIPIYTSGATAGDEIPLWSMNESTGTWVQEGIGIVKESASSPTGLVLAGEVSHFTWWNCDHFDGDPDEAEGLCYKYECFNGICNKVKVFCWVEGAIHGDTDKRNLLDPPVFSAREFFPAEGGVVDLPGGRAVTLRGTVVQDSVVLRGDTTFTAVVGGHSSFELILDTTYVATVGRVTLPVDTIGTFQDQAEIHILEFEGRAGQVIGYRGTRVSGPSVPAVVELKASDGSVVSTRSVDDSIIPVKLPADDSYRFVVTSTQSSAASYRLRVETVSGSVQVNSNNVLPMSAGEFRILQFQPVEGRQHIVGNYAEGAIRRADLIVRDSELGGVGGTNHDVDSGPFVAAAGIHYLFVIALPATQSEIRFGLSEVKPDEPVVLTFDNHGEASIQTNFSFHGQHRYFQFDLVEDDGFEVSVHRTGTGLEYGDFRLYYPTNQQVYVPFVNTGWSASIVFGWSGTVAASGRYTLDLFDDRFGSVGEFEFRLRRVAPQSRIVVDDDLSCPDAVTSSIAAALYAVPDDGTVFLCDGEYDSPSRPNLLGNGITIEGESQSGAILRFGDMNRSPATILDVQGRDILLRNFTLQPPVTINNRVTGAIRVTNTLEGNVVTFEDLTIEPTEADPGNAVGQGIEGDFESVVLRNVTYANGVSNAAAFTLKASSILVEDSQFENAAYFRRLGNENMQMRVTNSTFDTSVITVQNAADGTIEDSFIGGSLNVTNSNNVVIRNNTFEGPPSFNTSPSLSVTTTDASVVQGNAIDRPVEITVGEGDSSEFTRNRVHPGTDPEVLYLAHVYNETGGTIVATNNVIEGSRPISGNIRVYYPDLFENILFGNNTIVQEQAGNLVETVPSVALSLRDLNFTGDLPVSFVNNIFVGDGTTVFSVPANTTIEADYNLYFNYAHVTVDGSANRSGANDLSGVDPLLTGADLQLQLGSPAINSGASSSMFSWLPSVDFSGAARPQGAGYDRGAWEQ